MTLFPQRRAGQACRPPGRPDMPTTGRAARTTPRTTRRGCCGSCLPGSRRDA